MLRATSVIPVPDGELYRRADVVVYGVVLSSRTVEDGQGQPETVTEIRPVRVLKGALGETLVIRQAGGTLPDGRFFKLWGRPEYAEGHEVIVFAIARPEGDYQTAEMLLGKFEVERDEAGRLFAVPELVRGAHPGVTVHRLPDSGGDFERFDTELPQARFLPEEPRLAALSEEWSGAPRELAGFLDFLDAGARAPLLGAEAPAGELAAVVHEVERPGFQPQWGYINDSRWRWNNGAAAGWTFDGSANMTGGGTTEAAGALATWTNDPNSTIGYTVSPGSTNPIHLSATSSSCGWSTCLTGAGVIGCGGPRGGGSHSWRGDSYSTITGGEVWLRCYATLNAFGSVTTQSVLTHELGHTLGLGHSDQNVSPHDACTGDESAAMMRSYVQNRTTLGTDDQDAIRWLYGDGGNHCTNPPGPTVSGVSPGFGPTVGGTTVTINGANFVSGATVSFGGTGAATVTFVDATRLTVTAPAHAAGFVSVAVTNPDAQNASLSNAYDFQNGTGFFTLDPCRVLDTRNTNGPLGGPALSAGADRTFTVTGQCGIPAGAKAISANVTVTQSTGPGDLKLTPAGTAFTAATAVQYGTGQTRANNAVIALSPSGAFIVHCDQGIGNVQFVVDVNGHFE